MNQIICIGSSTKDVFFPINEGDIVETPEDMESQRKIVFELGAKYQVSEGRHESVGGCAANVACGLARLGLKSYCCTRVGDDQSGSWIKKELENIKLKLDAMRESLSKNVEDKKTLDMLEPEVGDTIDQATQSLDKEILFELSDNERKMLDNIDASLRKMDNGIYGLCEHCKTPIERKRIKALPSARYCLPCQSGSEKNRQ